MAQEEIKLVGSFKDDITPKLKKLTKQIDSIGRSFEKFNRNLRPISREFGRMAASAERFNASMAQQRSILQANARAMGEYKKQAGRMAGAMRTLETQRAKAARAQGLTKSQQKGGGSGGAMPMPATPSQGKGTGKAYGAAAGASFKQSIGATAIGTSIGMMASQAIMSGVRGLKNLVAAPFKKFGDMFSERIRDEMDDIKSAGGLYALDMDLTQQSGNERFFKNYNEALRFQEKLNISMAESAASLPGVTSQYVDTSRQLTDTIQMVMDKDREGFAKYGKQLGANITGGGVGADKEAFRTVLQKQTEQVMLMSQGQTGGLPMHIALQQLLAKEKDKKGGLGMQGFVNKYRAAFQKNPMLKNMLIRAEKDMAETGANSVERLKAIMDVFNKALPKEQINKMRGSLSGLMEGLRSGLLDPQAGLFGMSRASMAQAGDAADEQGRMLKKNVDDFGNELFLITKGIEVDNKLEKQLKAMGKEFEVGQVLNGAEFTREQLTKLGFTLDKNGKIFRDVNGIAEEIGAQSMSTTYIFEQIRETIAGFAPPLLEFVGFLPHIFDPFAQITSVFNQAGGFRDQANAFISSFNGYIDSVDEIAAGYLASTNENRQRAGNILKGQARTRSAFAATADLLKSFSTDTKLNEQLEGIKKRMGQTGIKDIENFNPIDDAKALMMALINSDFMKSIGKMLGTVVGGIARGVVDMIKGVLGLAKGKTTNLFLEGFQEGFGDMFKDFPMTKVSALIADVISTVFIKISEILLTQVLPAAALLMMQTLTGMVLSGNPVGMIIGALGLAKFAGLIIGLFGPVTAIFQGLVGAVGFVIANFSLLSGILGTVLVAIVAPVLAVAGAIMIVIAVVRNFGNILKMIGGVGKMIAGQLIDATSQYIGALGNVISWIPGLGKVGEGLKNAGQGMKDFGDKMKKEGFNDIKEAASGMKKQFDEDTAAIKQKFGSFTASLDPATYAASSFASATNEATEAQREASAEIRKTTTAFSLNLGSKKTGGTEYSGSTYTAGGIEYDAATGLPVSSITGGAMYTGAGTGQPAPAPTQTKNEQGSGAKNKGPDTSGAQTAMDSIEKASNSATEGLKNVKPGTEVAVSAFEAIPPKVETALVGAATTAGSAITSAAQNLAQALASAAQGIANAASATSTPKKIAGPGAKANFMGSDVYSRTMPLGEAIGAEMKNKPPGSDLVIANSSETVIPAFNGHAGDGFKGFSFAEMESAAGFNRMATYTDQIAEIANKTANNFSMGGMLGGGSATLNAMEALGNANGLMTTSGFRPGDPGFHGANRARDLSDGSGETPGMNKVAGIMASQFGQSLTELIYTPLGFSIKNGQKTGLISPDNHYHHIHVAVAEGLANAAVFNSQKAAMSYEKSMMPPGSSPMKVDLSSMTANSSEFSGGGGQNLTIGDIHVNVSGADNPREIANEVADEILQAIKQTSYTEIFSS